MSTVLERFQAARWPHPVGDDIFAVGKRVYARALRVSDLPHVSAWAADPLLDEMVGSELFTQFVEVYRRSPSFLDALAADRTQVNMVICARDNDRPLGLVRLFNIHRREGYAFLETIIADPARSGSATASRARSSSRTGRSTC